MNLFTLDRHNINSHKIFPNGDKFIRVKIKISEAFYDKKSDKKPFPIMIKIRFVENC